MLGYVKKDKMLDIVREEIDFCRSMIEKYERIIEALRRDDASSMTIQIHEKFLADWDSRWYQSRLLLSKMEQMT